MAFVKARGGGHGLDAELAAKRLAQFDPARAAVAVAWLCELSNSSQFPVEQMWARLKDGHILCQAANRLAANACPKVNSSAMPFKQMENITAFINACRNVFKVPEHELFETVDLYEEKDLGCFVTCICSLGRIITASPPRGFTGPHIGYSSIPGQVVEQPAKHFDAPSPAPRAAAAAAPAAQRHPHTPQPAPPPAPAPPRAVVPTFHVTYVENVPATVSPRAAAPAPAAYRPASRSASGRPPSIPASATPFLFEGALGKSKGCGMMGMIGYKNRYFTLDASFLRWYNDRRFEDLKGYMCVPLIQGFERVPGVHHKGKIGIEIKGANVGKGTSVKSYFLWAPTQAIAQDLFRALQIAQQRSVTSKLSPAASASSASAPAFSPRNPAPAPAFAFASRVPVSSLTESQTGAHSSRGRDTCNRCCNVVYHAECMQGPGGLKWHKICFRCTCCDKAVDSMTSSVTADNVLMCKTCYARQKGPVGYGYGGALASETQGKA